MAKADIAVIDQPVEGFDADDLFFSRTDPRGVIQSCNSVFLRLSGYGRSEVIGAPHKIIRHPDMPRAVFSLMWQRLKAGAPFAGYVKNRAEDGRYYWVFAVAVEMGDSLVSVRLKPGSATLDKVAVIYRDLRKHELSADITPKDSAARLQAMTVDLGFASYEEFAADALSSEMQHRQSALDRVPDSGLASYADIAAALKRMDVAMANVVNLLRWIKGSPTNLAIQGGRLQKGAETLKVIAQNYASLANEIEHVIGQLQSAMTGLRHTAQAGRLGYCARGLLSEAIPRFAREQAEQVAEHGQIAADPAQEDRRMTIALGDFEQQMTESHKKVVAQNRRFSDVMANLKRVGSGLAMTRVMCRIEAAQIVGDAGGIHEIGEQLNRFQIDLGTELDALLSDCKRIDGALTALGRRDTASLAA
ncbi:PAS domain-containing protein [Gymnodinialimonas sp. 2305UL16-5]|uniref:PAS domain-containing protein n=1 Tax=Gymnodinialimonas mytili TaxID=3126503 RepID=UPI0030B5D9BD